jgi:hypothetical protein
MASHLAQSPAGRDPLRVRPTAGPRSCHRRRRRRFARSTHMRGGAAAARVKGIGFSQTFPEVRRRQKPRDVAAHRWSRGVVRAAGLEPAQALRPYGFSYQLRLSPPWRLGGSPPTRKFVVWTIPSPWRSLARRSRVRCCPSSLYTFPRRLRAKGLARDCHVTGFPEFGQFCIAGFPTRTQACSSPLRLPVSPRPQSIRYSGTRRWGQ